MAKLPKGPWTYKRFLLLGASGFLKFGRSGAYETIESTSDPMDAKDFGSFEGAKEYRDCEGHLRNGTWRVVEVEVVVTERATTKLGRPPSPRAMGWE